VECNPHVTKQEKKMSNKQLAAAVANETGDSAELVERVIHNHQNQYPGSWQDWTVEAKTPVFIRIMEKARKSRETTAERIVLFCS
jgi:hypothetical protein